MDLRIETRSHCLDWCSRLFGSRLIELDVWIEATPEEAAKLKDFNMLKRTFFKTSEMKTGAVNMAFGVLMGAGAYFAASWTDGPAIPLIMGSLSGFGFISARQVAGKEGQLLLKVEEVLNRKVPFTFDNPAHLHEMRLQIEEQYQHLFGAMFEIEHFGETRETVWHQEEALA